MFKFLAKLIPKKWIVKKVSACLADYIKEKKHQYLAKWEKHTESTPPEVDDAALLVVRQVVDPAYRSEEMTRALEWMIRDIERQTLENKTPWDNGVGGMLRGVFEVE